LRSPFGHRECRRGHSLIRPFAAAGHAKFVPDYGLAGPRDIRRLEDHVRVRASDDDDPLLSHGPIVSIAGREIKTPILDGIALFL